MSSRSTSNFSRLLDGATQAIGNEQNNTLTSGYDGFFEGDLILDVEIDGAGGDDLIEGGAGLDTLLGGEGTITSTAPTAATRCAAVRATTICSATIS